MRIRLIMGSDEGTWDIDLPKNCPWNFVQIFCHADPTVNVATIVPQTIPCFETVRAARAKFPWQEPDDELGG